MCVLYVLFGYILLVPEPKREVCELGVRVVVECERILLELPCVGLAIDMLGHGCPVALINTRSRSRQDYDLNRGALLHLTTEGREARHRNRKRRRTPPTLRTT